jgi:hypothetical protein
MGVLEWNNGLGFGTATEPSKPAPEVLMDALYDLDRLVVVLVVVEEDAMEERGIRLLFVPVSNQLSLLLVPTTPSAIERFVAVTLAGAVAEC